MSNCIKECKERCIRECRIEELRRGLRLIREGLRDIDAGVAIIEEALGIENFIPPIG